MKILIAGGGIGGLVTALCLIKNGYDVSIFESAKKINPLGVGINILPHAVRILDYLGLIKDLEKIGIKTSDLVYANRFGQSFLNDKRGTFAGYKWPQFSIHRGLLHNLLFEKVKNQLGESKIFTGHHLSKFSQKENKITAYFIDPLTNNNIGIYEGDVLIGADGIHSVSRKLCFPNEGEVVYSGNILYRGTAETKPFLNGSTMAMIGSNLKKMVVYPISPINPKTGLQIINWVGNIKESTKKKLTIRDWNREIEKSFLESEYYNWEFEWLDVLNLIRSSPKIYEFPMSDRNPLKKWSFGRFTLLGDAAHPMYPIGSNGASQAILDAAFLTKSLNEFSDPTQALINYEIERLPQTEKIVIQNRMKGPDAILDIMENRFPKGFNSDEIPHDEIQKIMSHYKEIAGFDINSLNMKEASL